LSEALQRSGRTNPECKKVAEMQPTIFMSKGLICSVRESNPNHDRLTSDGFTSPSDSAKNELKVLGPPSLRLSDGRGDKECQCSRIPPDLRDDPCQFAHLFVALIDWEGC
jgi:hypothetical protein